MATAALIILPVDTANLGKQIDCVSLTVSGKTVLRQNMIIADPTGAAYFAQVDVLNTLGVGGLVAAGVAASGNPVPVGGTFSTTPATITTGQAGTLQLDSVQNLLCNVIGNVASGVADAGAPVKVGGKYVSAGVTLSTGQRGDIALNATAYQIVEARGNVASAATDSGNPVKVGGKYNSTAITLTDGQRGDLQLDASGFLIVGGNVGAAVADAGNPIKVGAIYTTTLPAYTNNQRGNLQIDPGGNLKVGVMPIGTQIYNGSGNVANASAVATLAAVASKWTYLDGFDIDGLGATAGAAVAVTIVGVLGGTLTLSFGIPAGATVPIQNGHYRFNPPLQSALVNTAIVVTVPAAGTGNTAVSCTGYGHYS